MLVDDEQSILSFLTELLGFEGHEVSAYADATTALAAIREGTERPEVILVDLNMPVLRGEEFCRLVGELGSGATCVVMSAEIDAARIAADLGLRVLPKPFDIERLFATIEAPALK